MFRPRSAGRTELSTRTIHALTLRRCFAAQDGAAAPSPPTTLPCCARNGRTPVPPWTWDVGLLDVQLCISNFWTSHFSLHRSPLTLAHASSTGLCNRGVGNDARALRRRPDSLRNRVFTPGRKLRSRCGAVVGAI